MEPDKKLSEDLQQKEAWLASFPEKNPNPILEISLDGRIEYTNPTIRRLFPTIEEQQTNHPFLVNWTAIAEKFRNQLDLVINRDVRVGEEYFQ